MALQGAHQAGSDGPASEKGPSSAPAESGERPRDRAGAAQAAPSDDLNDPGPFGGSHIPGSYSWPPPAPETAEVATPVPGPDGFAASDEPPSSTPWTRKGTESPLASTRISDATELRQLLEQAAKSNLSASEALAQNPHLRGDAAAQPDPAEDLRSTRAAPSGELRSLIRKSASEPPPPPASGEYAAPASAEPAKPENAQELPPASNADGPTTVPLPPTTPAKLHGPQDAAPPPPPRPLPPARPRMGYQKGTLLRDRYQLSHKLIEQGTGSTWAAFDRALGAKVIVRLVQPPPQVREPMAALVRQQTYAVGAYADSCLVRVLELGECENGDLFVVTEYVEGQNIEAHIRRWEAAQKPFSLFELRIIFEPVVTTLAALHRSGMIHGNLRPDTLMVCNSRARGAARLLELGPVRLADALSEDAAGLETADLWYTSPEISAGQESVGPTADVYSLGMLLLRALGVRPPAHREQVPGAQHSRSFLSHIRPDLHGDIQHWAAAAVAPNPAERFQTVDVLWNVLRQVLSHTPLLE